MMRTLIPLVFLLAGCSAIPPSELAVEPPELVSSTSLPPIPSIVPGYGMRFTVMIHVMSDGTVGDVKVLHSGAEPGWDSLALDSIMKWRFLAGRRDGTPVDIWIRQPLVIQIRNPVFRTLAQLICVNERDADSLYALLALGADFDSIFRQSAPSPDERDGYVGSVDISIYPAPLRNELLGLREGEVSRPVRHGSRFVIYRRLKSEPA
jgi:TonB family protein